MLLPFTFAKLNIFIQRTLFSGCLLYYNCFLTKTFAVLLLQSTYKRSALYNRNYSLGFYFLFFLSGGEHNLKSKPLIIYALLLPTVF